MSMYLNLGKRIIQVGDKALGVCDNVSITVEEATLDELIELQNAHEIKLVRPNIEIPKKED